MIAIVKSHRDLIVWQKSMSLAVEAYRVSKVFPVDERYRITSQLLRAAASVPANIAEGHARGTRKDYAHFISIARGSLAETETFLLLAEQIGIAEATQCAQAKALINEVGRMLNALLGKLRSPESGQRD
jgi:four helix bundle protein